MAGVNSRQEYLKRYLDDPKLSKSKKKKRKSESCYRQSRFKIVDEDIDMKKIEVSYKDDDDESDEAPFIASVTDDRPEEVKVSEMYSSEHWRKFDSSVKVKSEIIESTELCNSSCNSSLLNGTEIKKRNDSDDDLSPLRRSSVKLTSEGLQKLPKNKNMRRDSDSDISPPRVRNTATSDSDLSPPRGIIKSHHRKQDRSPPRNKDHHHYRKIDKTGGQHHVQKDSSPSRSKAKDQHNKLRNLSPSGSKADKWCHKQKNISPVCKTDSVHHIQKDYSSGRTENNSKYSPHSHKKQSSQVQHSSDSDFSPPRERRRDDDERPNFDSRARHNKIQADHLRSFKPSQYSLPLEKQQNKRMKKRGTDSDNGFYSDKEYNCTKRKNVEKQHSIRTKKRYDSDDSDSYSENERNCSKIKNVEKQRSKRTKEKHDSDSDSSSHSERESNCTKNKNVEKQQGKRTKTRHDSGSDSDSHSDKEKNSAKRKNVSYLNSQSSVPKGKSYRMEEESRHKPHTSSDSGVKKARPNATLSGMKAGLQNSASLQEEIRNLKYREKMALDVLDDELSGRNAETVSRDKNTGRRRNLKEERLEQKEKDKKKAEKLEKYLVWGTGLKQKDDQQKKIQEDMYEMSKPLARYADDDDLERELKEVLKDGDPMLEYMKKKRKKNQLTTTSSLPIYEGPPAPPNRFSIPPGYRWDGVDRSNGFEKRFFEKISNTKATEHQAYLWSIENM